MAEELEAERANLVAHQRVNVLAQNEALSMQCRQWAQNKTNTRDAQIETYRSLGDQVQELTTTISKSKEMVKSLKETKSALHKDDPQLREVKSQIEMESRRQKEINAAVKALRAQIKELKDGPLLGVRGLNKPRKPVLPPAAQVGIPSAVSHIETGEGEGELHSRFRTML